MICSEDDDTNLIDKGVDFEKVWSKHWECMLTTKGLLACNLAILAFCWLQYTTLLLALPGVVIWQCKTCLYFSVCVKVFMCLFVCVSVCLCFCVCCVFLWLYFYLFIYCLQKHTKNYNIQTYNQLKQNKWIKNQINKQTSKSKQWTNIKTRT